MRGYFGVGIYHPKTEVNIGSLWRTADILGAAFVFTIGRRYSPQCSDTGKAWKHIPLFHYETVESLWDSLPRECRVIGVELDNKAVPLERFYHPEQAIYLLGAEDHGLPEEVLKKCHGLVKLTGDRSMNVAVAGSIVIYDRQRQRVKLLPSN